MIGAPRVAYIFARRLNIHVFFIFFIICMD